VQQYNKIQQGVRGRIAITLFCTLIQWQSNFVEMFNLMFTTFTGIPWVYY
jgi:hypothetical protein